MLHLQERGHGSFHMSTCFIKYPGDFEYLHVSKRWSGLIQNMYAELSFLKMLELSTKYDGQMSIL